LLHTTPYLSFNDDIHSFRIIKFIFNTICYYNKIRYYNYPITVEDIKDRINEKINEHNKYHDQYNIQIVYCGKRFKWVMIDNYWSWLKIKNLQEKYLSKNYFDELFDLMLEEQNLTIELIPSDTLNSKDIVNTKRSWKLYSNQKNVISSIIIQLLIQFF